MTSEKIQTDYLTPRHETPSSLSALGARNVALFLSCLEPDAADALLASFEPQVANEIALEASRIDDVSQEELQRVIALFLDAMNEDPEALRLAPQFVQCVNLARNSVGASDDDFSAQKMGCTLLAKRLKNERPAVIAAILARLKQSYRLGALNLLSEQTRAETTEFMRRLKRPALACRQFENVLNRLVTEHE